eukprot:4927915-Pyramimonas_sp.AAC.1
MASKVALKRSKTPIRPQDGFRQRQADQERPHTAKRPPTELPKAPKSPKNAPRRPPRGPLGCSEVGGSKSTPIAWPS